MSAYIKLNNLTKNFGETKAVDNISLSVSKGEVLGLLGPNGAGKTTTMRMITGFLTPDEGEVLICDKNIKEDPLTAKKNIGYLPEGAPLYFDLSPKIFLEFIASVRGIESKEKKQKVDEIISTLGLEPVFNKSIDTLSKGFKRRVALAQAIMHDPKMLILDEPTDGLDPIQKHEVRNLIKKMSKDKAIIISTHILEEVEVVCDRVAIIANGKIKIDSTPNEILKKDKAHNSVYMKTKTKDLKKVKESLLSIDEVISVEQEKSEKINSLTIFSKNNLEIIDLVSKLAHEKRWDIISLEVQRGKLEQVFRDIVLK